MITLEDCKQAGEYNYKGLSTDTKPTNCYVNSLFLELDTGIFYFFTGTEWKDIKEKITLGETEPTGTVAITNNGIFDVHDYAEANVDVPAITPTGAISITENGTYDIANYAEASVDVDTTVNFNLPKFTRTAPTGLSQGRNTLVATTVGDYALFGGGYSDSYSSVVDAYDQNLTRTTPTELSEARYRLAATTVAPAGGSSLQSGYALFGGGQSSSSVYSSVVDAYNTSLTRTTPTGLSQARRLLAATTLGNYALFGGGESVSSPYVSDVVNAYDTSLTRTTPTGLSQRRRNLAATTVGNYALFGGGYESSASSVVDAYNTSLTRTTPTVLSQGRFRLAATTVGDYALFGGGYGGGYSNVVDAYSTLLTRTTPTELSEEKAQLAATTVSPAGGQQSGYALFGGGYFVEGSRIIRRGKVDAYNTSLVKSIAPDLSQAREDLAATTVGDYALFGGGHWNKVETVDAYTPANYDIQVFPGTKYSFNGNTEQTSSTWQTISMQGEVTGYIKVKDANIT